MIWNKIPEDTYSRRVENYVEKLLKIERGRDIARREEVIERHRTYARKYYSENRRRILEKNRTVYSNRIKIYNRRYYRERRQADVLFRLKMNVRSRLRSAIREGSQTRNLGCSVEELKMHLESKFKHGMTWSNYGQGTDKWNIDHITPLSWYDLTDHVQLALACHYSNLQPMWCSLNSQKGNSIIKMLQTENTS